MKITTLVFIVLLSIPSVGHADSQVPDASSDPGRSIDFGMGATGGFGWVTHGGEEAENQFVRSVPKPGKSFGLLASISPHERFVSRLEILYMAKGADVETLEGMPAGTLDTTYLGGTLLGEVNVMTGSSIRPYAFIGAEFGYLLKAKITNSTTGNITDLTEGTTTLDVGLIAGAGVGWRVAPRHELLFETRVDIGLRTTDSSEGNDNELLNRSLMFMLGYRFSVLPGH